LKFAIDQGLDYEFEPINGIIFQHQEVLKTCMEDLFKKKAKAKIKLTPKPALSNVGVRQHTPNPASRVK